jgi:hypothetical protein
MRRRDDGHVECDRKLGELEEEVRALKRRLAGKGERPVVLRTVDDLSHLPPQDRAFFEKRLGKHK